MKGFVVVGQGFLPLPKGGVVVSRVALLPRLVFSAVVVVAGLVVLVVAQLAVAERPARPDPTAPGFQRESREAESVREERAQRRRSPGGREERRRARLAFRGLDGPGARALARRVFPGALDSPLRGMPVLEGGERIERYIGDHWAQIDHGGSSRDTVLRSFTPLRVRDRAGDGGGRPGLGRPG